MILIISLNLSASQNNQFFQVAVPEVEDRFRVSDLYRNSTPRLLSGYNPHHFDKLDKSVFCLDNSAKSAGFLEGLLSDSWRKFQAGAFLYQYENFGLDRDWFRESFNVLEKVNLDYSSLLS